MSIAITGNLIVLELQNLTSVDSDVNLFAYPNSNDVNSISTQSYSVSFSQQNLMSIQGYYASGLPFNQSITSTSISDLVNQLNTNSVSWFGVQCTFTLYGSRLIITDLNNTTFTSIIGLIIEANYYFSYYDLIKDSTVSVTTFNGLTYPELVSELVLQPYYLESMNVYANNVQQVGTRIKKAKREANGIKFIDFNTLRVDPMQKQFAIENVPIKFTPSPINYLNYRVKGNQTVRLLFYYKHKDKLELTSDDPGNEIEVEVEVEKSEKKIDMKKEIKLPLFELIKPIQRKKMTIKEKLSSKIVSKDVTNEEIYTAFDGLDFKQC